MKKAIIGAWAAAVAIAAAAQGVSIYLDVKRLSSSKSASVRSQGHYHENKDYAQSINLGVMVKNMAQTPELVDVEWFFVAKTVQGARRWIYDAGTQTVAIAKASHTNLTVASSDLESSKNQTWWYNEQTGSKYEGYVVRVKSGGIVVALKGSSRPMEEAGRSETELAAMIKAAEDARKQFRGNR